ncbi:MAG: alpha/beta fold hydrolase [Candidatus Methanosuratincola sp.]|jgi:polyhydroxyalkanoate synthase
MKKQKGKIRLAEPVKKREEIPPVSILDRMIHAWLARRMTLGISPAALLLAYSDWFIHSAIYPGRQLELMEENMREALEFLDYSFKTILKPDAPPFIEPMPQDKRFEGEGWERLPFKLFYQSFLLAQHWFGKATTSVRGVSRHHEDVVSFVTRQILDVFSPSNFVLTNPEVLGTTLREGGANLVRGWLYFLEDLRRYIADEKPVGAEKYRVGKEVAVTPGKVVYRNRLIELIQYAPQTEQVYAEPILIVPAWIMKYYILDLSPHNSLVKYLVENGHTVFIISWKNPRAEDRDLGMEDYLNLGVMESLDAVRAIVPGRKVHTVGYCLGGTLLSIAAAALARDRIDVLQTVTLFTTLTDFREAGELTLFIDESQVSFLEGIMWDQGYLDRRQMAQIFQILRSTDLIWSRLVHSYLLGEPQPMFDLMAWNADTTRLPFRMHSEYLRSLYLNNDLAEGRYQVGGKAIALSDIRAPIFMVATEWDHVSPWKSVYKLHLLADTEITFLLTSGGHNAGIVSEPGHPRRVYRVATKKETDPYVDPDAWMARTPVKEGSWWPEWQSWLVKHSSPEMVPAPKSLGAPERGYRPLEDAPGTYVYEE